MALRPTTAPPLPPVLRNTLTPDSNLLTLDEYKGLTGTALTDTRKDDQITALLPAVSKAVRNYTGRSFALNDGLSSDRTFLYDGSGILDIDDCAVVNTVSTDAGYPGGDYPLLASQFTAMPFEDDVFYWLIVTGFPRGASREMGFTSNLDTLGYDLGQTTLTINAQWGWPVIPADVKLAAAWTLEEFVNQPEGEPVSEAIESYSRSFGAQITGVNMLAVPNRARDLLSAYQRVYG